MNCPGSENTLIPAPAQRRGYVFTKKEPKRGYPPSEDMDCSESVPLFSDTQIENGQSSHENPISHQGGAGLDFLDAGL